MSKTIRAWHFVGNMLRDGSPVPDDGVRLVHTRDVIPCESGLHASEHPFDALQFAPGPVLCLVECGGIITTHGNPVDKIACSERTIIARMDATPLLRWFARMQALSVAHLLGDAPAEIVLDWLMTGDDAARAAARDAARDAAWAVARAAARAGFAALVHEAFEDWL